MRGLLQAFMFSCAILVIVLPALTEERPKPDSWRGIPLMPGYHSEGEAGHGYVIAIDVSFNKAEEWYRERLKRDGWTVAVRQRSAKSLIGGGPMVSLDFKRGEEHVNIMLIYSVREKYTMAMHTRISP